VLRGDQRSRVDAVSSRGSLIQSKWIGIIQKYRSHLISFSNSTSATSAIYFIHTHTHIVRAARSLIDVPWFTLQSTPINILHSPSTGSAAALAADRQARALEAICSRAVKYSLSLSLSNVNSSQDVTNTRLCIIYWRIPQQSRSPIASARIYSLVKIISRSARIVNVLQPQGILIADWEAAIVASR
jgi:prephenate dehydratase